MYGITQTSMITKNKAVRPTAAHSTAPDTQAQLQTLSPDLQLENRLRNLRGLAPLSTDANSYTESQLEAHLQALPDVPQELPPALNEWQRMSLISRSQPAIERVSVDSKLQAATVALTKMQLNHNLPHTELTQTTGLVRTAEPPPTAQGVTAMLISQDFYLGAAELIKQASYRTDYLLSGDKESAGAFIEKHNPHLKNLRLLVTENKDGLESRISLAQLAKTYLKGLNFECTPQTTEEDYRKLMYKTHDLIQRHIVKEHHTIAEGLAAGNEGATSYKDLTEEVRRILEQETNLSADKSSLSKQDKIIDSMGNEEAVKRFLNHYEKSISELYDEVEAISKKNEKKCILHLLFCIPKKGKNTKSAMPNMIMCVKDIWTYNSKLMRCVAWQNSITINYSYPSTLSHRQ
jgi:hypothetical protein